MCSLFILLQAWKLYDLVLLKNDKLQTVFGSKSMDLSDSLTGFVLKYFFLDGSFLISLQILRIPMLDFRFLTTILQLILMYSITILVTKNVMAPIAAALTSMWRIFFPEKEMSVLEKYVNARDVSDQSSHFKGSYTIRYLPDSSVSLNPFRETFCINGGGQIEIPIKVNTTSALSLVQIKRVSFESEVSYLNLTRRDIERLRKEDHSMHFKHDHSDPLETRISFLNLKVDKPGRYEISQALDEKGKPIRAYKHQVPVPACPSVRFVDLPSNRDFCVGDRISDTLIEASGYFPLKVTYNEQINGKLYNVEPVPLEATDQTVGNAKMALMKDKHLTVDGEHFYILNGIEDGLGNTVQFQPTIEDTSIVYRLEAHKFPSVELVDSCPSCPLLSHKPKRLDFKLDSRFPLPPNAPYEMEIAFLPSSEGETETFSQTFNLDPKTKKIKDFFFLAKQPGSYTVKSFKSRFCSGTITNPTADVVFAPPPTLSIASDPILDKCIGTVGYKFSLNFSGSPDFEIEYKVSKLDERTSRVVATKEIKKLRSASDTLEFEYKPQSEGSYAIEFLSIRDRFYQDKIKFAKNQYRYTTYFNQRSSVRFSHDGASRLCYGAKPSIGIDFQGKPPFSLSYVIRGPDGTTTNVERQDIGNGKQVIHPPKDMVFHGGRYSFELVNVSDHTNCAVDFSSRPLGIEIRADVPELQIPENRTVECVQGSVTRIPLLADFKGKADVVYSRQKSNGDRDVFTAKGVNHVSGLEVSEKGVYSLVSFKHDGCPGNVSSSNNVTVSFLPKPSIRLLKRNANCTLAPLCQGETDKVGFTLGGAAPFLIKYSILHQDGKRSKREAAVDNPVFHLDLETDRPGVNKYIIEKVSDSAYTQPILDKLSRKGLYEFSPIELSHQVNIFPSAVFSWSKKPSLDHHHHLHTQNSTHAFQACVSNLKNRTALDPIMIDLKGSGPFSMRLNIENEAQKLEKSIDFVDVDGPQFDASSLYQGLKVGLHFVNIKEVRDSTGCSQNKFKDGNVIAIAVNEPPKIERIPSHSPSDVYCVGDHISYNISGESPFSVYYQFGAKRQKAISQSRIFRRRTTRPGVLSIDGVSDSSAKNCLVPFSENERPDLTAVVYDLPSVEISEGDIVEDIHQGDKVEIVFTFSGVSPFTLTYTRSDIVKDDNHRKHRNKKKGDVIVETSTVENIEGLEYRIWAELEGTYEAVRIADAHCVAHRY